MLTSRRRSGSAVPAFKAELLIGAAIAVTVGLSSAQAATFGHSRIVSALGQPLHVEIPVTQLTEQEIASLHAVPAPAQAWRDAGMTPPVALDSMRLVLLDGYRPGVKIIQLRSPQPFGDSIVDVLLDISSASGQQRYQVSLLAQTDRNAVVRAGGENARHPRAIDGSAAAVPAGTHASAGARIRVRAGDNMFAIAQRNAVEGVTVYQLMMALQRANPNAFIEDNVNLVKAGATLVMPDLDVLTALSDREARRAFQQHADAFARYRQRGAAGAAALSAAAGAAREGVVSSEGSGSAALAESPATGGDRLRLSGSQQNSARGAGSAAGAGQGGTEAGGNAPGLAAATGAAAIAGQLGSPAVNSAGGANRTGGAGINLLAANGTVASDAVGDNAPHAAGSDNSAAGGNPIAAIGDRGTAAGSDNPDRIHPDDQAALKKGVDESRTRILELEDNVRHLNQALQQQGQVAAEAALEGARSVTEAIKEAIGLSEPGGQGGTATPSSDADGDAASAGRSGASVDGRTSPAADAFTQGQGSAQGGEAADAGGGQLAASSQDSSAAGAAGGAAREGAAAPATTSTGTSPGTATGAAGSTPQQGNMAGSGQSTSSDKAETEVSWLQENMLLAAGGGLALIVLIVAWLLRRAGARGRDAFESDSPITDAMVREKLQEIDLDLDRPAPDTAGRHAR